MFESNKRLGEIAEISLLTNRWCMWADSNLPGHKTYVPAVFQTRDAYYHFIDMVAMGVGTDAKPGALRSDNVEEIGRFWTENLEMGGQLNGILHHISRGFFDVVDHICIQLVRQKKPSGSSDCYMWYDRQLRTYSTLAQRLRAEKSRTPDKTVQTVRKWDILLQHITSAYTIADENARAEDALTAVHKLFMRIEAAHTLDSIEKACKNYMDLKVRFEQINVGTDIAERLTKLGERVSHVVLEDNADISSAFIDECECMRAEVEEICAKRYEELEDIHRKLSAANGALFSTTKVQRVRKRTEWLSQGVKSVFEILTAAIPTYLVEKRLFQKGADGATATLGEMLNDDVVVLVVLCYRAGTGAYRFYGGKLDMVAYRYAFSVPQGAEKASQGDAKMEEWAEASRREICCIRPGKRIEYNSKTDGVLTGMRAPFFTGPEEFRMNWEMIG